MYLEWGRMDRASFEGQLLFTLCLQLDDALHFSLHEAMHENGLRLQVLQSTSCRES